MYYSIVGANGVAVMSTLEKAEKLKKYIKNATIHEFMEFENAEFGALSMFQRLSPVGSRLTYLQLDHAIFNKDIINGKTSRRRK